MHRASPDKSIRAQKEGLAGVIGSEERLADLRMRTVYLHEGLDCLHAVPSYLCIIHVQ